MNKENISIHISEDLATMKWIGTVSGDEYRKGHDTFLELLAENLQPFWLFNYEKGKKISLEDQRWTIEEWLPKALSLFPKGVEKLAVVVAKDIFNRVAIRIITAQIWEQNFEIAYFDDEMQAMQWLKPISVFE